MKSPLVVNAKLPLVTSDTRTELSGSFSVSVSFVSTPSGNIES